MASYVDSEDAEIREGFLCPICRKDLGTISQLQLHFDTSHSTEDKAVFHSFKDLFGKAKKKILKSDALSDGFLREPISENIQPTYIPEAAFQDYQELGATSSHTDYFKTIRSSRIDRYVVETNKLLIRLDKIISDSPLDPAGRKAHERNVVYWVDDNDVARCPNCGRSFTFARRKHHCRLCGGIMCANCSDFILFSFARKLTNPSIGQQSLSQPCSPMHRSGSNSSLNSLLNVAGEPHLRVCVQCKQLLDRRDHQMEERMRQPMIVHLYERLKACMEEAERLCPIYMKMATSLNAGEKNYHLRDAQELRVKVIKLSESVDILSKQISGLNKGTSETCKRDFLLQKGIRNRASSFLKDNILGLMPLPSEEDLHTLQLKRQKEIQRRIALEKQAALEAHQHFLKDFQDKTEENFKKGAASRPAQTPRRNVDAVSPEVGWGPETAVTSQALDEGDPMIQQMQIIRNYIKQARDAHLYDEVHILETNLKELQHEYYSTQKVLEQSRNS